VETPTCVAVALKNNEPKIIAPLGINDLVQLIVRPSPTADLKTFIERYQDKKWLEKWPKLRIVMEARVL